MNHNEKRNQGCGSVSGAGVGGESVEPNDSVASCAPLPTSRSDGGPTAQSSSKLSALPSPAISPEVDVRARAAQATYSRSVDVRENASLALSEEIFYDLFPDPLSDTADDLVERVRSRNAHVQCGICTNRFSTIWMSTAWLGERFFFCGRECRADFHLRIDRLPRRQL